jgi:hypothetical protein
VGDVLGIEEGEEGDVKGVGKYEETVPVVGRAFGKVTHLGPHGTGDLWE